MQYQHIVSELTKHPDKYVRALALSHALRGSLLISAIAHLDLPENSAGIDLGCGIGLPAILAVTTAKSIRHVTGIDIRDDFIAIARRNSSALGLDKSLTFERGDIASLKYESDHFNWALSVDCVNYGPGMSPGILPETFRVLKPGGKLALMAWSSQQLLPGYPDLEAQLNTTREGLAPFESGMAPENHFLCTSRALANSGFQDIRARTFIRDIQAPLTDDIRAALESLFEMRWTLNPTGLSTQAKDRYLSLISSQTEGYILNDPCYYGYFTYTLFEGRKPA